MNDILSNKSKKVKKYNDEKPYFENTHQIFTPSWINYKNPSLNKEDDEDFLEEGEKMPTGKALLKKIYGGAIPTDPSPFANKRLKAKGGSIPCGTSCKKKVKDHYDKVVDNYTDVINHLEEHLQEKVGDPLDAKQAKTLKREVKRVNELHLIPAMKVGTGDPLYKVSNPREVQKKAFETYGKDAIVYKSSRPKKKYQMVDKLTGKMVYFGDANMEDFTKHQDEVRKERYLKRALNIRGNWRSNPFSPNVLSILLLW